MYDTAPKLGARDESPTHAAGNHQAGDSVALRTFALTTRKILKRAAPTYSVVVASRGSLYRDSIMEHGFTCPYCGEEISMVLDLSVRRQIYVEDCEVCCKPIEVSFTVEDDDLASFDAKTLS